MQSLSVAEVMDPISDDSDVLSDDSDNERMAAACLDLSTIFSTVPLPVSVVDTSAASTVAGMALTGVTEADKLSHDPLLKTAVTDSGLASQNFKRLRVSGKQSIDGRLLHRLRADHNQVKLDKQCSKVQQTKAYNEFRYWYIRTSGSSWNEGAKTSCKAFRHLTNDQCYHWFLLSKARASDANKMIRKGHRTSRASTSSTALSSPGHDSTPDGSVPSDVLEGPGVLVTYFPKLGQDDPTVGAWIR